MTELKKFNDIGTELEERLQLRTFPIAVKMLKNETDIPAGAIRPRRDMGSHISLCQAFAKSRREKATIAMLKEDNWCYVPVVALGLSKPSDYYLEGYGFYPEHAATQEIARKLAAEYPRLEYGKYIGTVSAPLRTTGFEPEMAVIYCNAAQLRTMLSALKYIDGYIVRTALDPTGACVQATVPVVTSGECQVTVPCRGDQNRALAREDEMILSVPANRLADLLTGVRHLDEVNSGYLFSAPAMQLEYKLSKAYIKLGKLSGIDIHE